MARRVFDGIGRGGLARRLPLGLLIVAAAAYGEVDAPPAREEGHAGRVKENVVYQADFQRQSGPEWSQRKQAVTPAGGQRFLGEFTNETVSLTLKDLPEHGWVRLTFDLYLIRTWDGNHAEWGPDVWRVGLRDGATLLHTTFGYDAVPGKQAFPGDHPISESDMETGAAKTDALGYVYSRTRTPADAVYKLTFLFPHTGKTLQLDFEARGNAVGLADEAWGLDNVQVAVRDRGEPLTEKQMETLWSRLDGCGAAAYAAKWRLIAAGPAAARFLRAKLQADMPADEPDPAALIAQLDARTWQEREAASRKLLELGPRARVALEAARDSAASLEVRLRARELLDKLGSALPAAERRRQLRAHAALRVLTGQAAPIEQTPPESSANGAADQRGQ